VVVDECGGVLQLKGDKGVRRAVDLEGRRLLEALADEVGWWHGSGEVRWLWRRSDNGRGLEGGGMEVVHAAGEEGSCGRRRKKGGLGRWRHTV
jgi:hypothetical protein